MCLLLFCFSLFYLLIGFCLFSSVLFISLSFLFLLLDLLCSCVPFVSVLFSLASLSSLYFVHPSSAGSLPQVFSQEISVFHAFLFSLSPFVYSLFFLISVIVFFLDLSSFLSHFLQHFTLFFVLLMYVPFLHALHVCLN